MRYFILFIIVLTMQGCGARILAPASVDRMATDIANLKEANHPSVPHSDFVRDATNRIADDMAATMSIDPLDLPKYITVTKQEWVANAESANARVKEYTSKPLTPSDGWMALAGGGIVGVILVGLRVMSTYGGPYAPLFSVLSHLFLINDNPKQKSIADKMEHAIITVQNNDPKWEENPVFKELSNTMTQSEKDYIRDKKVKRRKYGKV